jgi:type IV pilus assembly protein PilC
MPLFTCTAVNTRGDRVKDRVDAPDKRAAVDRLRRRGLTVIEIAEQASGETFGGVDFLARLGRVRTADIVLFFRMFSALINSNISVSEAIAILHDQTGSRGLRRVLGDLRNRIEGGTPLSEAMAAHPRVFDGVLTGMIRAAELGGILDVILERIADYLERRAALKRRIMTSMIYPAVVAVAGVAVVVFMVTFVIPKFAILMGGRKLPSNTQFLLDVSAFLTANAAALVVSAAGAAALIALLLAVPETRIWVDRYRVFLPVVGPVFRYGVVVQFANTLASLLESGITLVDALKASAETVRNLALRKQMDSVYERVQAGEALSEALAQDRFFPPMVGAMVKVGEHSGLMDQTWATVGRIHERLLEDKISRMSAMVEPALIVVLGGLVAYVAWGLVAGMLAMYAAAT